MNQHAFDTVSRTAAEAMSRRASVVAVGAATLAAAFAGDPVAAAKNNGSKRAKKKLKKVKRQFAAACAAQSGQCQATVDRYCSTQGPDQGTCLQNFSPCCALITDCDVRVGLACLLDAFTPDP